MAFKQEAFDDTKELILDGMRQLVADPDGFDDEDSCQATAERQAAIKERHNLGDEEFADYQTQVFAWILRKCAD